MYFSRLLSAYVLNFGALRGLSGLLGAWREGEGEVEARSGRPLKQANDFQS
jgi:hypothetical protein